MSFFSRLFGKGEDESKLPDADAAGDEPFMEYPSDDYKNAIEALTSAFERLKSQNYEDRWITFCGQGRGHDDDSDLIEELKVRRNTVDLRGQNLNLTTVVAAAGLDGKVAAETDGEGMVMLRGATAEQMARFLDAVFRVHFGIRPHEGEHDYAVGAEW
jgi:hypothetical protein